MFLVDQTTNLKQPSVSCEFIALILPWVRMRDDTRVIIQGPSCMGHVTHQCHFEWLATPWFDWKKAVFILDIKNIYFWLSYEGMLNTNAMGSTNVRESEISPLTPNKKTIDCTNETCMFITLQCTPQAHTHTWEVVKWGGNLLRFFLALICMHHRYLFSFGNVQFELAYTVYCLYSIYCIRILLRICVYALHIIVLHLRRYIF